MSNHSDDKWRKFWKSSDEAWLVWSAVKKYREAVAAWEKFAKDNADELKMWSILRREAHAATQRQEQFLKEEAQRGWLTWDNVRQNTLWLVNGDPPTMPELANALGIADPLHEQPDGSPWYQNFWILESDRRQLREYHYPSWWLDQGGGSGSTMYSPELIVGAAETWAKKQEVASLVGEDLKGGNFLAFGMKVAYLRGYMEYNAQWLRQCLWFNGNEPNSTEVQSMRQHLESSDYLESPWLQAFSSLNFSEQVNVVRFLTRKLPASETGKAILLEMMDEEFPFSFNVLGLFDREKRTAQPQRTFTPNGEKVHLISNPDDDPVGSKTFVQNNGRWVLSGDDGGKSAEILEIGNRLCHALSRRLGDRSRSKKLLTKSDPTVGVTGPYWKDPNGDDVSLQPAPEHLVESLAAISQMFGSIMYGAFADADLATFSNVSAADAQTNIRKLKSGQIKGSSQFTTAAASGKSPPVAELKSFVDLIGKFHDGVTSIPAMNSPMYKLTGRTTSTFIGGVSGFLTGYMLIYHEKEVNFQNAIQDSLAGVNRLMGVRDEFSDIFKLAYKVGHASDVRTMERLIMESDFGGVDMSSLSQADHDDIKDIYNRLQRRQPGGKSIDTQVDELLTTGKRFGRTIQDALGNVATVIETAKSAYDTYQLFEVGDTDAAVMTGMLGTFGVVGLMVGGWPGIIIELLVVLGSIFVAHFIDEPLLIWARQCYFGAAWGTHDYSGKPRQTQPQWFKYDDSEEGTSRQLSSYKNLKIGFQLAGSGSGKSLFAQLLMDSGGVIEKERDISDAHITVAFKEIPAVDKYSKFILRPVVAEGNGYALEPPMYVFSMPNDFDRFKHVTGHETSFVSKNGSLGTFVDQNGRQRFQPETEFHWDGAGPADQAKLLTNEMAGDFDSANQPGIHRLELVLTSKNGRFFSTENGKKPWGVEVIHVPEDNFSGTFEKPLAEAMGSDALKWQSLMLYKRPNPRMIVDINR